MDILDNVVPYISGEEEKMEPETRKILGHVNKENMSFIQRSGLKVSATCTRVNVTDGHMAFVSLRFAKRPPPSAEQVKQAMRQYISDAQKLGCPSAPNPAITVLDQVDRPQPRLDRDAGRGYSVSVGRVREDKTEIFDVMFAALSHNSKSPFDSTRSFRLTKTYSHHRRCWLINFECRSCCLEGIGVESCLKIFEEPQIPNWICIDIVLVQLFTRLEKSCSHCQFLWFYMNCLMLSSHHVHHGCLSRPLSQRFSARSILLFSSQFKVGSSQEHRDCLRQFPAQIRIKTTPCTFRRSARSMSLAYRFLEELSTRLSPRNAASICGVYLERELSVGSRR